MNEVFFMQRAIDLALLGLGKVSPNPMVGCVIVHNNKVVGEGWHKSFGSAHAEVNAIHAVTDKSILPQCEVFVTLEPCAHFGKTPPCVNLLIKHKVKKVHIGCLDPNPLVAGKGVQALLNNGIDVQVGVMPAENAWLLRRFYTYYTQKRPYVVLKWAQSADGFIAPEKGRMDEISYQKKKQISAYPAQVLNHQWRTHEDAIMVATNTALTDNPRLNVRHWNGKNPVRIVIDLENKIPPNFNLKDKSQPTLIFTQKYDLNSTVNLQYIGVDEGVDLWNFILSTLYQKQIQSVLIEGGAKWLNSIINTGIWDEARVITSPNLIGNGIKAPRLKGNLFNRYKVGVDYVDEYLPA